MRLDDEAETTLPTARAASQETLIALVRIGGGAVALFTLCTFGPAIVEIYLVLMDFVVFEEMRHDWRKPLPGDQPVCRINARVPKPKPK
jgi:hypothetical protein